MINNITSIKESIRNNKLMLVACMLLASISLSAQTNGDYVSSGSSGRENNRSILEIKREDYLRRKMLDSIAQAEKEQIWDRAMVSAAEQQEDGYFFINIYNLTDQHIFIYIDDMRTTAVMKGSKLLNYKVRINRIGSIYAITGDKKFKWGPIDMTNRIEDFYWKLTMP